jgi:5-methylcytosine-specific restriction endonuclease McrA
MSRTIAQRKRLSKTYRKNKQKIFVVNLEKYGEYTCENCYKSPLYRNKDGETKWRRDLLTADHIIPLGLGGGNEIFNLRVLCGDCNNKRDNENN